MRRLGLLALLLLVGIAVGLVGRAALDGGGGAAPSTVALPVAPVGGATDLSLADAAVAPRPGETIVARGRRDAVAIYARPDAARPERWLVRRTVEGRRLPVVLLVLAWRPGARWLKVSLPVRPNHASGWVRAAAVRLARDAYRVEVQLSRHRLVVYEHGRTIMRTAIAVGRAVSPTPTGRYFVTDLLRSPDPDGFYGPYAFGLSAYSPVYTSFAGGDGQIGIHGTNAPQTLGGDVSHGCIRVRNAVVERLARRLPLGTPVRIRA